MEPKGFDDAKTVGFFEDSYISEEPLAGWVVPLNGQNKGKSFIIHAGISFIGRDASADVVLSDDLNVSPRHANIVYDPQNRLFYISPADSEAAVLLDDRQIFDSTVLKSRQTITVGGTRLLFVAFCNENFSWK